MAGFAPTVTAGRQAAALTPRAVYDEETTGRTDQAQVEPFIGTTVFSPLDRR